MIEKIKNAIQDDDQVLKGMEDKEKTDDLLKTYIMSKAREHLDNENGAIEDEIVYGWAKHFYIEPLEEIQKENKELQPKPKPQKKEQPKPQPKKESNQLSIFDL